MEVLLQATNEMGLVSLIAPTRIQSHVTQVLRAMADVDEAEEAEEAAEAEKAEKARGKLDAEFAKLILVMRRDLEGKRLLTEEEIERIVTASLDSQDGLIETHRGS